MPRNVTPRTSLESLKREAKRWLRAIRANVAAARERLLRAIPDAPEHPTLRDVQHALAREHGLAGWRALKDRLEADAPLRRYERVAEALVSAYHTPDAAALRVVWEFFGHMRARPAMRRYVRLDLGKTEEPLSAEDDTITLEEARDLVARSQEFESWDALVRFVSSVPPRTVVMPRAVQAFAADASGSRASVTRSRDWDDVVAQARERYLDGLDAQGQATDAAMESLSRLDHLAALDFGGSKALSDSGVRHLARLPRLRRLDLSGTGITDEGLEVLRRLPALEHLSLAGTRVTDAGMTHLSACRLLRTLDLSWTRTGDGAIGALAGMSELHDLRTGGEVTDAGAALLRELPVFAAWRGGEEQMALTSPHARPNMLVLRGRVTNAGMWHLAALEGLFALDLDDAKLAVTGAGLVPIADLPHLAWLGFDAKDESMPFIAALPHLRFLMCQDTEAGDDGFVALSRSRTIEHIWGRRCYNLRRRGFVALADMPALRYLSVSCRNVDDAGLSALPRFPALRELMPMDVPDEGYRHVGRCERLESLVLMYCRETTDAATAHITGLANLKKYFASYNRITDRTPELLSGIPSLEEVTFDSCAGLTSAGIAALARLPRLRQLNVSGMRRVTRDVVSAFPTGVTIRYSV